MRKKLVILLLVVTLAFESIAIPNIKARAEPATVVASLFAALPITWPLIVGILVAAGIGTAAYYASLPDTEKQIIFDKVANVLRNCGENMLNISQAKNTALINGGDYIRGAIVDGITYISTTDCLEPVFDLAETEGWLGGQEIELNGVINNAALAANGAVLNQDNFVNHLVSPYAVAMKWNGNGKVPANMKNKLRQILQPYQDTEYYMVITASYSTVVSGYLILVSSMLGTTVGSSYTNTQSLLYSWNVSSIQGRSFNVNYDLTAGVGALTTLTKPAIDNLRQTISSSFNGQTISSWGNWNMTSSGVPEGSLGQVANIEGVWSDPWASGADKDITDYGTALPVSGAGTIEAGATWEGDTDIPDSLVLPGVSDPAIDTDIPDSFSQAAAQEGDDYEYPQAVDDVSPVTPDAGAFSLPASIMDRFPFCIAKDIKTAISTMASSQAVTPVISGSYLGTEIEIDFSWMDSIMVVVRAAELLLYAIGLAMATKYFTRW